MNKNISEEIEYFKTRGRRELYDNKEHLIALYGKDGYDLIRHSTKCKKIKPFAVYKKAVWKLTEEQPLHLLENYERRGFKDYHVDHIVSIFKAFKKGWTVEQCGGISNLQMLPYKENLTKHIK